MLSGAKGTPFDHHMVVPHNDISVENLLVRGKMHLRKHVRITFLSCELGLKQSDYPRTKSTNNVKRVDYSECIPLSVLLGSRLYIRLHILGLDMKVRGRVQHRTLS